MPFVVSQSTTTSSKGQGSTTNQTTTTAPREDTQTSQKAITLQIAFTMRFRGGSPVTPEGETEPDGACA